LSANAASFSNFDVLNITANLFHDANNLMANAARVHCRSLLVLASIRHFVNWSELH
jgi:hypothetical protein